MNVNLKLSGLYSSLFVIRFSIIFQKKIGGGGGGGSNRKEPKLKPKTFKVKCIPRLTVWDPDIDFVHTIFFLMKSRILD